MMNSRLFVIISTALAAIIVLALAFTRWSGAEIRRPLLCDEFLTLEDCTWAGLTPSGEPHRLRRVDDYRSLPRVEALQLGMGIYRSLGVWREPNNHAFHSLLVNFAIASGRPDERTVRMPALLGAIASSILAFWLCRHVFGWPAAAPLAAVVIFCLPYMVQYSQEARGYSWMIALLFLQLGLMHRLARQPDSIVWGASCALVAVLTFINMVNLALDWLLPLYLALLIWPPIPAGEQPFSPEKKRAWRRNLLVQMLAFGSIGIVFMIDRLPAVYSAAQLYGIPFDGPSGFLRLLVQTLHYLFPGIVWEMVAVLGLTGILIMLFRPSHRSLAVTIVFILAISLMHFWLAGKFPYERACGYLAPLAVLGTAYLGEIALRGISSVGWRNTLYGGLWTAIVGMAVLSLRCPVDSDKRMEAIPQLLADQEALTRTSYVVLPAGSGTLKLIFPTDWIDPGDPLPDKDEVNLVCCLPSEGEPRLLMEKGVNGRTIWRCLDHLPKYQTPPASGCRLAWQRMALKTLRPETVAPLSLPCLIVWRPAPNRLGLDGHAVREHIARYDVPYLQHNIREPAKLSFFSRLATLDFLPQSPGEVEKTLAMVKEGMKRFGGSAWLLQPLAEPEY